MRRGVIVLFSALLLLYTLGPFFWLLSSSFQSETEIVSRPPHWIPHHPTLDNYKAIFGASERVVTYETRRRAHDMSRGVGFIPETAKNLLPALRNSFMVAVAVAVVVLNLLVAIPAGYALAKIRFRGR